MFELFNEAVSHLRENQNKTVSHYQPKKKTRHFRQEVFDSIETFFPFLQRVQNGGIHVAGDNGTIQPIPFSFDATGENRMQQSKYC